MGWFAMGGGAWGVHAIGKNAQDEIARNFFAAWTGNWLDWMYFIFLGVFMLSPLVMGILTWTLKGGTFVGAEHALKKMRWSLSATGLLTSALWILLMVHALDNKVWEIWLRPKPAKISEPSTQSARSARTIVEFDWQKLDEAGRLLVGTRLNMDGRTVLKIENTNDAPLQLTLFKMENPPIQSAAYAVLGEIKYDNVQGSGYLEMWNYFPPVSPGLPEGQYFSRTLGEAGSGPMGRISGTASWRPFALPFDRTGLTNLPTRLEINIFLPGRGVVWLGPPRLMP